MAQNGSRKIGEDDLELASRAVPVQSKRFYVDVKQNERGRYLKLAEVGGTGQRSRVLMTMAAGQIFLDTLVKMGEEAAKLEPWNPNNLAVDGKLTAQSIVKDNRRYYFDLKENNRGRFLRISMATPMNRSVVVLPVPRGIEEVSRVMSELLQEYCPSENSSSDNYPEVVHLPESKSMRVDNKMFYFDVGSNRWGMFLRVSEVRTNYRTAVTIPERMWVDMRNTLNEYIDHRDLQRKAFNDLKIEKEKENAEKADGDAIDKALEDEGTNENHEDQGHEVDVKKGETKAEIKSELIEEK